MGVESTNETHQLVLFHTIRELKAPEIWSKTEIVSVMTEETIWTWCLCVVGIQMNPI